MTSISFRVYGDPGPQGSKTKGAFGRSREASAKVGPWREAVKAAALAVMPDDWVALTGPLSFSAQFFHRRPASHYGTGRNEGKLKATAPRWKASSPDLSKLVRSSEDALTDCRLWHDDRLVVQLAASDVWSDDGFQGAVLRVSQLADEVGEPG